MKEINVYSQKDLDEIEANRTSKVVVVNKDTKIYF